MGTMPMEDEEVPMMVGAMSPAGISFSSEQHTKVFEAIPMSKGLLINSAIGLDQAPVEVSCRIIPILRDFLEAILANYACLCGLLCRWGTRQEHAQMVSCQ